MARVGASPVQVAAPVPTVQSLQVFTFRGLKTTLPSDRIRNFAFGQSAALSSSELHRFKAHNESIVRGVGARLSLFLRIEFTLELLSLDSVTMPKFVDSSPPPRHMILFKIDPLRGIGVLDVPPPLALAVADRMLGGKGFSVNPNRALREVEIALVNQMAQIAIKEWCSAWKSADDLRPNLLGHESNPRFLQIGESDESFFMLKMEAGIGDCIEQMLMLLPVKMVDPLVRQLSLEVDSVKKERAARETSVPRWNPGFDEIKIPMSAEWRELEIQTRDLLNFQVGDIIPLDANQLNQVQVCLAGLPKYMGRLGSSGNKSAVEITGILST
ncbi:MAG: FliM/FliN family flagellar motor switch protein [Verrucomicrobia bacterium]|nr:FliM/FliN family flagellar motor switch protein [Verrucomicrobiota bacterium]